jgi:hypothetical protein
MANPMKMMTTHNQLQARKVGIHPNHNENDLYGEKIGRKTVSANMYAIQQQNAKYFAVFIAVHLPTEFRISGPIPAGRARYCPQLR